MQLYKHLDCDNYQEINEQIKTFIDQQNLVESTNVFWNPVDVKDFVKKNPLFLAWLNQHKFLLHSLAVTVGKDFNCCSIHVDTPPAVNKLSWPVLNTQGTYNRWYKYKVDDPKIHINHLGGKSYLDPNELEEIGRMEVTRPCIINAGIPHDVLIMDPAIFPRIGLQCMLFLEPNI